MPVPEEAVDVIGAVPGKRCQPFGEGGGILLVVVDVHDVGQSGDVRPAGGINVQSRPVVLPGDGGKQTHESGVLIRLRFVQRAPADDGGMVEVPRQHLAPFGQEILIGGLPGDVQPPVGVLAPNKVAGFIAVIKKTRLKHFFVQSCAVKA